MFGGHWVKVCVFVTLQLPVAVAEFLLLAVRNGDKVTLRCEIQSHNCSNIDWLFAGSKTTRVVKKGKVFQQDLKEYPQLNLTSDCSLEILNISEKLVGQFNCRSVVSMTRTQDHLLTCSVKFQDVERYKVRWLYDGKPYLNPEPMYGDTHSVTMSQDDGKPLQEELFSCEVTRGSTVVNKFPFNRHFKGLVSTTPTTTSSWSENTGLTALEKSDSGWKAPSWWPFAVAASAAVALLCILVVVIIYWRVKGKKKEPDEKTSPQSHFHRGPHQRDGCHEGDAYCQITISNHLYDQIHQQHKLNPVVDECSLKEHQEVAEPDESVSYASISYTKKRPKVTVKVADEEGGGDAVTYSTVKVSR